MKVINKRLLAVLCGVIMICNSGMGIVAHAQENMETLIWGPYRELTGDNIGHGIYDIPDNSGEKAATLTSCTIGISVNASGVKGSITTGSTVTASKIGVENAAVRIRMLDENGNLLNFFQEPIMLKTEGPVNLIGGEIIAFKGGMAGTYLKTTGEEGRAALIINSGQAEGIRLEFTVKIPSND